MFEDDEVAEKAVIAVEKTIHTEGGNYHDGGEKEVAGHVEETTPDKK